MAKLLFALVSVCMLALSANAADSAHEFTMKTIDGNEQPLSAYKGKVALFVNVASRCGFTSQYKGLEALYKKYADKGLVVLGFPANNFGGQEPGTNAEIKQFCQRTYGVSFPMFAKVSVKGSDQTPLYGYLTSEEANAETAGDIRWNFTKFLVDANGKVIGRFESRVAPDDPTLVSAIEDALQ
jgi:glutathione peroxidase